MSSTMKCHYEVLDVASDADDAQIKVAYRKLALKWHPDKNLDNAEYAKTEFQIVQQAYDILSDRQERAWYDKHREQILCGSNSDYASDLNIFQYFTTSCFKGYGDDENGFFTVYKKAFEEIIQDDIQCMLDKEELLETPSFGVSTSDYEEVVAPFYDYWMSYNTKKSFIWLDHYNIQQVRDKRLLKLIEKEHKKARQKAKKEWNEEVRALVAFVRKRDKRVKEYSKIREAKILENRQKNEDLSKQKRLERQKLLNESRNTEAEWTKFDNVKGELEQIEKSLVEEFGEPLSEAEEDNEDVDLEPNNLYCVACNKVFKSPKAFQNHELSKKHKENVLRLKETMEEDSSDESASNEKNFTNCDEPNNCKEELSDSSVELQKQPKQKKKQKKAKNVTREGISEDYVNFLRTEISKDDFKFDEPKRKTKNRKNKVNGIQSNDKNSTTEDCTYLCNKDELEEIEADDQLTRAVKKLPCNKEAKENYKEYKNMDSNHCCVSCKSTFPSGNKLFNHLMKTGHSVHIPLQCTKTVKNKRLDK